MAFLVPVHAEPVKASAMFPPLPVVGSRDVTSIEPQITRPDTPYCTVELFPDHEFDGPEVRQVIDYAPPVGCSGLWSRVVLEADFSVSAGQQFDRTVRVRLGGVNILTGTTVEPARKQGRHGMSNATLRIIQRF
ncbi:peptide-N4-asparagine amidase [Gluconobacter oxydans]|uniref:peptide-N4-asparagine amidase n=1 Tax=Gluconobacter oxydans TaxID=442 RepID=UPI0039EC52F0